MHFLDFLLNFTPASAPDQTPHRIDSGINPFIEIRASQTLTAGKNRAEAHKLDEAEGHRRHTF